MYVARFKDAGKKVIWQCGSAEEAAQGAKRAGADMIIAQGVESGGHVRGLAHLPWCWCPRRMRSATCRCSRRAVSPMAAGSPRRWHWAPTARS